MSFSSNAKSIRQTPVFVLAGGRGDRLFPLSASRPKPLLPLGPFRILDFTLLNCRRAGLSEVTLLTQYQHDQIGAYVREEWNSQFQCRPPSDGMRYSGTSDSVFQSLSTLDAENVRQVLILSGDQVYRMDYRQLLRNHVETDADVTIASLRWPINQATSFGVLETDRCLRVTSFHEKPRLPRPIPQNPTLALISIGIYVFRLRTLAEVLQATCGKGRGYDFGEDVVPKLVGSARVHSFEFRDQFLGHAEYWRDIGTIDSYHQACMEAVRPNPPYSLRAFGFSGRTAAVIGHLSPGAQVRRTMLGNSVRVDDGAEVEDSVLMPGVRIGPHAIVRRAIVDEGVEIPAGTTLGTDIERDRKRYAVSPGGVVVVSRAIAPAVRSEQTQICPVDVSRSNRDLTEWQTGRKNPTGY